MIDLTKKFTIIVNITDKYSAFYAEDSVTSSFVQIDLASLSLNTNQFEQISKSKAGYLRSKVMENDRVVNLDFATFVLAYDNPIYFVPIQNDEQLTLLKLHGIFIYEILQN